MAWAVEVDGQVFGRESWWQGRVQDRGEARDLEETLKTLYGNSRVELKEIA